MMLLIPILFAYFLVVAFFLGFFTCVRLDRPKMDVLTATMLSLLWPLSVAYVGVIAYLSPTSNTGDGE
jgi:hypothetical protein